MIRHILIGALLLFLTTLVHSGFTIFAVSILRELLDKPGPGFEREAVGVGRRAAVEGLASAPVFDTTSPCGKYRRAM